MGKGFFLFTLGSVQEVNVLLANGPYFFRGNPVYVTRYIDNFSIDDTSQMEVLVWMELPFVLPKFLPTLETVLDSLGKVLLLQPTRAHNPLSHIQARILWKLA
ncbi:hypothetical protein O6H91_Y327600 [Diphasiastrum complanatum]|nr:hypothetical protein O6H91_Y327600 [Diphasiastrum complanatum]